MSDSHKMIVVDAPIVREERTHPLVAAAMAKGSALADPATLRQLMDLQERWEAGEARKSFTRALAALKRDLPTVIAKDSTVDFTSARGRTYYKHASLAGVMDAITEPLTAHGFSLSWVPSTGEKSTVRVTCRLTHAEGHSEECSLDAPADTSGSKSPAQAVASTITLLQRYTALALLGIATADMQEEAGDRERERAPEDVDADRNLRAASWLVSQGFKREDYERHVGRKVSAWTAADLAGVKPWAAERRRQHKPDTSSGELTPEEEAALAGAD